MVMVKDRSDMYELLNVIVVADAFAGPPTSVLMLNAMQVESKRRIARMEERNLWNPC